MMTSFWILALGMCLVASGFILVPLYLHGKLHGRRHGKPSERPRESDEDRTRTNVDIYEERLEELQTNVAAGDLSEADFELLKAELQTDLLSDADEPDTAPPAAASIGRLPIILAILVPAFALFAYSSIGLSWGSIGAVQLARQLHHIDPNDKSAMSTDIARLARQLKKEPDNDQGWFLLGQSYMDLQSYDKAAETFQHLIDRYPQNSNLASYFMQATYLQDQRSITPRVRSAIDRALKLNPHDVSALEILAMDAYSRSDFDGSLKYFRKALSGNDDAQRQQIIQQAIAGVEKQMRAQGIEVPAAAAVSHRSLSVMVEVGSDVKVPKNASVFVYARAVKGPPMPLAVQRLSRDDLPKLVKLDDSMGMVKGMSLADFNNVEVVARISSSGIANAGPDDYEARSAAINLAQPHSVITLKIEHRRKNLASN